MRNRIKKIRLKKPISKTPYADFFEPNTNAYLLEKEEAQKVWGERIDPKASSYYNLNDGHWLVSPKKTPLGKWLDDFNQETGENIAQHLAANMRWEGGMRVWYCISKPLIIESNWDTFKAHWISFLRCEDDGTFVIADNSKQEAFFFTPTGDYFMVG